MNEIWLDQIGPYKVEHHPIGRSHGRALIPLTAAANGKGILHTTEGRGVAGALSTLGGNNSHGEPDPSTLVVGEHRIVQCRPINYQASSLVGPQNTYAQLQIEMVCVTKMGPDHQPALWLPEPDVLDPMIEIMRFFAQPHAGFSVIPLRVPVDHWRDDGADIKTIWATNNTRRQEAVVNHYWPLNPGWWMHAEVPFQPKQWHYDCGKLERRKMFVMAAGVSVPQPVDVPAPTSGMAPFEPVPFVVDARVKAIQMQLGLTGSLLDARWGKTTQGNLVAFQTANGLPRTGQPNEQTLRALGL